MPIHAKRSCDTRWSSKHEAICVFAEHTKEIIEALEVLTDRPGDTSKTKDDAGSL